MKSELFLDKDLRKIKKDEILLFKNTFKDDIFPVFSNIEQKAEKLRKNIYDNIVHAPCDENNMIDQSEIAESATEAGLEYYEKYSLMRYNTLAMWICMLYQFWEQQARKFLYDEEKFYVDIEITNFCASGINDIKEEFKFHNTNIENFCCWDIINELRLLCNTLKHGKGPSSQKLRNVRPDFFVKEGLEKYDLLSMYNTTLLVEVLNIQEQDFYNYCTALINFWYELPENMHSNEIPD